MRGHGNEYMEMNIQVAPEWQTPPDRRPAATAAARGVGALGFAGAVRTDTVGRAAGLETLTTGVFGGGPTAPKMPATWDAEPERDAGPEAP